MTYRGLRARDCTSQIEYSGEKGPFPRSITRPPASQETSPAGPNDSEHKRPYPPIEYTELAALPGIVDALVRDLCAFASRIDVFNIIFAEVRSAPVYFFGTHRSC